MSEPETRVIKVIETSFKRGDGVGTPVRIVHRYYSMDGSLLVELDPIPLGDDLPLGTRLTEIRRNPAQSPWPPADIEEGGWRR